jgi:N6-adenosine-specific RNA methylase IME4
MEVRVELLLGQGILGTGRWNRNQHEHLLIARVGDVPAPPELDASIYRETARRSTAASRNTSRPSLSSIDRAISRQYKVPKRWRDRAFPSTRPARPGWSAWGKEAIQEAA